MNNGSVIGFIFWVAFIPVFLALLLLGKRKEDESIFWYGFKRAIVALVVGVSWLAGVSYYLLSNGI
jgi:hypothetical protein